MLTRNEGVLCSVKKRVYDRNDTSILGFGVVLE